MPTAADLYYSFHQGIGKKPPVVLLHGAGGDQFYWPPQLRRLQSFHIFALDLPGHGKSPGYGCRSIPAYVQSIIHWLGAVNLYQAIFVGHSMGSAIALLLALEHPEKVLGLGLLGAGARMRVHPEILQNCANESNFHLAVEMVISRAFSSKASPRLVELAARRMAAIQPEALHGDYLACDAFNVMEQLAEIQQPALVVCGEEDRLTPVKYAAFLADQLPAGELKIIPGAGHMVMLEQPGMVANILRNFMAQF